MRIVTERPAKVRAPRYQVGLRVICETPDGVWPGTVVDMSESGVLVETERIIPVGARVTLVPDVEDDAQLPTEMEAVAVRTSEVNLAASSSSEIAFRLIGLKLASFDQVRAYLRGHGRRRKRR